MHELGLAQAIVEQVSARAQGARVLRVVLEIGKLAAVLPDALRFCFDLAAEDEPAGIHDPAVSGIKVVAQFRMRGPQIEEWDSHAAFLAARMNAA